MSSPEIEVFITRGNTLAAWVGGELKPFAWRHPTEERFGRFPDRIAGVIIESLAARSDVVAIRVVEHEAT